MTFLGGPSRGSPPLLGGFSGLGTLSGDGLVTLVSPASSGLPDGVSTCSSCSNSFLLLGDPLAIDRPLTRRVGVLLDLSETEERGDILDPKES